MSGDPVLHTFVSEAREMLEEMERALLATLAVLTALYAGLASASGPGAPGAAAAPGCTRPIRVASAPQGRSMIIAADGSIGGIVKDFLDLVSQRSGCQFEYVPMPRARAFVMLSSGQIDIVPAATRTEERDRAGSFIALFSSRPALIALKTHSPAVLGVRDLIDGTLVLGIIRGFDYGPEYQQLLDNPRIMARVNQIRDAELAARMLRAGRIDALLMAPTTIADTAEAVGILEQLLVTPVDGLPFSPGGMYLSAGALDPEDLRTLSAVIQQLARQGAYSRLIEHYYASPSWALLHIRGMPGLTPKR